MECTQPAGRPVSIHLLTKINNCHHVIVEPQCDILEPRETRKHLRILDVPAAAAHATLKCDFAEDVTICVHAYIVHKSVTARALAPFRLCLFDVDLFGD